MRILFVVNPTEGSSSPIREGIFYRFEAGCKYSGIPNGKNPSCPLLCYEIISSEFTAHYTRYCNTGYGHGGSENALSDKAKEPRIDRGREQRVAPLSLVDILQPLSEEELEELAARWPDIRLEKGEEFYRRREHNSGLFLIKSGRVRVYRLSLSGKQLTLVLLSAGKVITGRRMWNLYAQAMEPSVVTFVRRADLERLIHNTPEVELRLIDVLADDLHLMDDLLFDVVYKDVTARLAGLILRLLDSEGVVDREGYAIPTRYTHVQLGAMIGSRRVAVTNAFNRLREAGAVETSQHRIRVRSTEALGRTATQEK